MEQIDDHRIIAHEMVTPSFIRNDLKKSELVISKQEQESTRRSYRVRSTIRFHSRRQRFLVSDTVEVFVQSVQEKRKKFLSVVLGKIGELRRFEPDEFLKTKLPQTMR